jgi:hypothetical protein
MVRIDTAILCTQQQASVSVWFLRLHGVTAWGIEAESLLHVLGAGSEAAPSKKF